ncbi:hypothetical protein [Desulfobacula sp.]|uniref:MotE family protein n=1 Tax=Desulfobacula sp. TaxID=2593537 RepID=UPI002637052D|nr:hypothetical protein [Desulfobacula sp.]
MKYDKKTLVVLAACLLGAACFSIFYPTDAARVISGSTAFAEEDNPQGNEPAPNGDGSTGEQPCPECPECPDPAKVVLRGLEDKRIMIEKQQKIQLQEKKELEIYEEQIDEKLERLKNLKQQIESDLAALTKTKTLKEQEKEAAYEAKIGRLVKMYAGMKPKNAAQIVDKMNIEVAQEIFLRMREASAAQILAFVDSERAAKISERLAFKKK